MKQCMTEGEGEEEGGDYRDSMHNINISQLRGPHGHRTTLSNSSTATGNTGTPNMTMIWEENSKTIDKLHKEKKSMEDQLITIKMRHAELEMTYDDLHDNHNSLKSVLEVVELVYIYIYIYIYIASIIRAAGTIQPYQQPTSRDPTST